MWFTEQPFCRTARWATPASGCFHLLVPLHTESVSNIPWKTEKAEEADSKKNTVISPNFQVWKFCGKAQYFTQCWWRLKILWITIFWMYSKRKNKICTWFGSSYWHLWFTCKKIKTCTSERDISKHNRITEAVFIENL